MGIAALIARLALALVFIVAGLAKLADRKGSRQALVDFGLPTALASPLAILLPFAELAVAATLLPTSTAWWGALGALALLLLFVTGIGLNLARGRQPDCHCFGQIHSAPAGWMTLARNGVLAILAGFLVWQGGDIGPSTVGWISTLSTIQLLGLVGGVLVLGLLAGLLVHRLRQNGYFAGSGAASRNGVSPLRRSTCGGAQANGAQQDMPTTRIGEPAPKIEIKSPSGEVINLWSIQGEETLVVFYNPGCAFCQQLLPDLEQWEEDPPEGAPNLLVISTRARKIGLESPVLYDRDFVIFKEFGADETPSAVLVDAEGKVASKVAFGPLEVLELAGQRRT